MPRVRTAYVSQFQRARVHNSRFYRRETFVLKADFNGALPDGELITAATWWVYDPFCVVLDAESGDIDDRETHITCTANYMPGTTAKVQVTTDAGTIMSQMFVINVLDAPTFVTETYLSAGPTQVDLTATYPQPTEMTITGSLSDAASGTVVAYCYVVAGSEGTVTFEVSAGTIPAGLTFNESTGCFSGTLTDVGTYGWCITATDSESQQAVVCNTIVVSSATITVTGDIASGYVGDVVSEQYSASGGTGPYTYSITLGALPSGITMNSSGLATGTFNTEQSASWTVQAVDSLGNIGTLADTATITEPALLATFPTPETLRTISQATSSFIDTYSGQYSPGYTASCPSQHKVYVGSLSAGVDSGMWVFDCANETYTGPITGTDGIAYDGGAVASANGERVAAHDYTNNLVYVFDATDDSNLGTITITNPVGTLFSADSTLLYVCKANTGAIREYDATTLSYTGRQVTFAADGRSMDRTPDGLYLYFARQASATITRITLADFSTSNVTVGNATADNHQLYCSLDSERCYVSNGSDNDFDIIDTAANTVSASVAVTGSPIGFIESPDGAYLYIFTATAANTVVKMDTSDNSIVDTLTLSGVAINFVLNTLGDAIYVSLTSEDIVKIDTATMTVEWTQDNTGVDGDAYGLAFMV